MKGFKRLTAWFLSALLVLSIAACGQKAAGNAAGQTDASNLTEAEGTEGTEGETTVPEETEEETAVPEETIPEETEEETPVPEETIPEETEEETTSPEETMPEELEEGTYDFTDPDFFDIDDAISYAPKAQATGVLEDGKVMRVWNVDEYNVCQGACSDGEYIYVILENQKVIVDGYLVSMCIVFKIDPKTWEIVAQSEPLPLDHGNDIAYNSNTGFLMVTNNYNRERTITRIDPETLEMEDAIETSRAMYAIGYNAATDRYVFGIRDSYKFVVTDSEFNLVDTGFGITTGFTKQNIDCDDDYIYFVQYVGNKTTRGEKNCIMCYNWDGEYVGSYQIAASPESEAGCELSEAESLLHIGDDFYLASYAGGHKGAALWKIDFDRSLLKK